MSIREVNAWGFGFIYDPFPEELPHINVVVITIFDGDYVRRQNQWERTLDQ